MKYVRKITPVPLSDAEGLESWLEDLALQGLYLKTFRPLFCTFIPGPAKKTRYRLEPYRLRPEDDLPCSMLELYQDFGWDYAGTANNAMLIFSTQDPEAPELHTDPALQSQRWNKLYRSARRGFVWDAALLVLVAVLTALLLADTPILHLLTTSAVPLILFGLYQLCSLPAAWAEVQDLSRLVRRLEAGEPMDHRAPYPRRRLVPLLSFTLCVLLIVLLVLPRYILPFLGGGMRPIGEVSDFSPLSLAQVEGQGYRPYEMEDPNQSDYFHYSQRNHYLLCWNQWEVFQAGQADLAGKLNWMQIDWYDIPAPLSFLSAPLADELLSKAMKLDEDIWWTDQEDGTWQVSKHSDPRVNFLSTARKERTLFQTAAAATGGQVVLVRYTGHGDLSEHLEDIIQMTEGGAS
ncbi:MAG: DUF2812 domain-containing protein [Oscillospiraceae bacterium]|nr:DUF2812 domain-containing protein [Oscillospiraceae bacterium]